MQFRPSPSEPPFNTDVAQRPSTGRPPALLLGGGLNLIRPLGFAGIPVIVASPNPHEPAIWSRYCHGHYLLPPLHEPEAMLSALIAIGDQIVSDFGCRAPLYYGDDDYLNLIYSYRHELSQRFLMVLNEPEVASALIDKQRFEAFARNRGLMLPRTLAWDGPGPDSLADAAGPVLVKPKVKLGWDDSFIQLRIFGCGAKARIFPSAREVMAHPLISQIKDQLTFQEYIQGDDRHLWSFHGYADENGTLLAWFVGNKIRTFPSLTGMSTYLELAHDETLAAIGHDIVKQLPLKGVFKIDFKKNAADGRFHVLEVNARFNLWHHMAAKNGVNLPRVAYDHLIYRKPPARTTYRTAFRWLCLRSDFRAYRDLADRGLLGMGDWLLSLLVSRKVYDLFSWTDPLPFLLWWANRGNSRLRRWRGHFVTWIRRWGSTAS